MHSYLIAFEEGHAQKRKMKGHKRKREALIGGIGPSRRGLIGAIGTGRRFFDGSGVGVGVGVGAYRPCGSSPPPPPPPPADAISCFYDLITVMPMCRP